jgi:hypothetical protein
MSFASHRPSAGPEISSDDLHPRSRHHHKPSRMNTSAISQMQLLYNEHLRAANAKFPRIPASGANNRLTNNSESAQLACFQSLPKFTLAQTESIENTGLKNHAGHQQLAHFNALQPVPYLVKMQDL